MADVKSSSTSTHSLGVFSGCMSDLLYRQSDRVSLLYLIVSVLCHEAAENEVHTTRFVHLTLRWLQGHRGREAWLQLRGKRLL